jgi:hypothetical protein
MEDNRMIVSRKSALSMAAAVIAGCLFALPAVASAQETTTTTVKPKVAVAIMTIDSAQVVYVSGDDAVLKMPTAPCASLNSLPELPFTSTANRHRHPTSSPA